MQITYNNIGHEIFYFKKELLTSYSIIFYSEAVFQDCNLQWENDLKSSLRARILDVMRKVR